METIAIISIIVVGVCFITNTIFLYNLYMRNKELNEELLKLSNIERDAKINLSEQRKVYESKYKKILGIIPGSKIITSQSLTSTDDGGKKETFTVLYEAEVLECTDKKVKIKAITYTSNDSFAKDASNKGAIIAYMNNKWIDLHNTELIIDDSTRRAIKLDIIGV